MENELSARIRNMPENFRDADNCHVCRAMTRGGGFMTALSGALQRADLDNRYRIHDAWADSIQHEWNAYRRQGGW
jgi:hypothetical protein